MKPVVLIPSRMASTRLPGKPLADILGIPMIVHVVRRAMEADLGPVVVACAEEAIADAVRTAGGQAVLTDPDHPSGSDRLAEALAMIDPDRRFDTVLDIQGDLPTVAPATVRAAFDLLRTPKTDIGTVAAIITDEAERTNPNVVKAVVEMPEGARTGRALYFTRATAPTGTGPLYHHIGLYAYRRTALEAFVAAPKSVLETREKLEQLRALAMGMRIDVALALEVPLGVDTPEDLDKARKMLTKGE
ncbi:MAG: 3-deoxy-manno-octulosonate cytidylyltransferase [Pseudomonadota bacterium]|nr:3-deoxy-manno-octulosonate cytidylyltransferase [Pseudomonadota bacterium]